TTWVFFSRRLKTGGIENADIALATVLKRKPKDVPADYLQIWQIAESWQQVYEKAAPDFQAHIKKAKSFAELGKNSDAIREYQAAFDIIENSSVSAEIKRLREQS